MSGAASLSAPCLLKNEFEFLQRVSAHHPPDGHGLDELLELVVRLHLANQLVIILDVGHLEADVVKILYHGRM